MAPGPFMGGKQKRMLEGALPRMTCFFILNVNHFLSSLFMAADMQGFGAW